MEPGVLAFPGLHVEAFGLEGHRQFSPRRHARFHPHRIAPGDDVGEVHGLLHGQAPILNTQDGLRRVGRNGVPAGGAGHHEERPGRIKHHGRRHGGAGTGPRAYSVRWLGGFRGVDPGKIRHLVIEHEARGPAGGSEGPLHGHGAGDGITLGVDDGEMGGAGQLKGRVRP